MNVHGRIISAVLLISVCAPAVQADLIADPNEFKQLKKLTGLDRQNKRDGKNVNVAPKLNEEKKQAAEKAAGETVKVKVNAKASAKADVKVDADTNASVTAVDKVSDKASAKGNAKGNAKANDKPNVRSKGNSATTATGEKAK